MSPNQEPRPPLKLNLCNQPWFLKKPPGSQVVFDSWLDLVDERVWIQMIRVKKE